VHIDGVFSGAAGAALPYESLREGLARQGMPLSDEDVARLTAAADPGSTGEVGYGALCAALGVTPTKGPAGGEGDGVAVSAWTEDTAGRAEGAGAGAAARDETVVGDGAHRPLRAGEASLFRSEPGGAFYPEPAERRGVGNRTYHTSMHDGRRRSDGLEPAGGGLLSTGRKRRAGFAPDAPAGVGAAPPLAAVHVLGTSGPGALTDPLTNPREAAAAAAAERRAADSAARPHPARDAYLASMRQHYRYAGGAAAPGNDAQLDMEARAAERRLGGAVAPGSTDAAKAALAEQAAELSALGLRTRHILLRGDNAPADVRTGLRRKSHTQIFGKDLPFAQEDAAVSGRQSRKLAMRRAQSAQRARRSVRLDAIRESASLRMRGLALEAGGGAARRGEPAADRADDVASDIETLLRRQQSVRAALGYKIVRPPPPAPRV